MSLVKLKVEQTTSLSRIPEGAYSAKVETFAAKAASATTTGLKGHVAYGVFVSDRAARAGSYSLTSSQETYRALNASLLSKSGKR